MLVFRYDILRFSQHHKRTYLVLGLSMAIVAAWVGFALLTRDWINFFSDFAYQGKYLYMKLLQLTFLSWPNPRPTLRPLFVELPVIGSLLVVSVLYLSAIKLKDSLDSLIANPGFIIFYVFVCFGILNTDYITTRYAFFVYPAALCTIALAISCFLERLQRKGIGLGRLGSGSAAVIVYFLIFAVSNEFNPSHIAQVGSNQVAFRTGPFERYSRTWYPRIDIRSPASFVNANAQTNQNDAVVVDDFSALSHYLDLPHGLYIDWSDGRFAGLSRSGGTRNTWTDGPLLGRVEDLRAYGEGHQRLWVIRPTDERRQRLPLEAAFGARIGEVERVFLSKDGRVEVLRMDLAQDGSQ